MECDLFQFYCNFYQKWKLFTSRSVLIIMHLRGPLNGIHYIQSSPYLVYGLQVWSTVSNTSIPLRTWKYACHSWYEEFVILRHLAMIKYKNTMVIEKKNTLSGIYYIRACYKKQWLFFHKLRCLTSLEFLCTLSDREERSQIQMDERNLISVHFGSFENFLSCFRGKCLWSTSHVHMSPWRGNQQRISYGSTSSSRKALRD